MIRRIDSMFYLVVISLLILISTIQVASAKENITGLTISPAGPLQANTPVTVTANASAAIGETLYYKFYYCANYGTDKYASSPWIVVQDYSTANTAQYTFPADGNYIVVVRAVTDPNNEPVALPIIGQAVTVGVRNNPSFTYFSTDFASNPNAYDSVTITVNADTDTAQSIYYKFYYCANYGTDKYASSPWIVVQDYSTANSAVYSFPAKGDYIVVARAVTDPNHEPPDLPITGGAISVNSDAGFSLNSPTGVSASKGAYQDKIVSGWSAVAGATGYNVYYSSTSGGIYHYLGTTTSTTGVHSSVPLGTTYFYRVTATSGVVESPLSAIFSGYTAAKLPSDNMPPLANAGADQSVTIGVQAVMSGSGSSDPDGNTLTYAWSLTSKPDGSSAAISNATSTTAYLTPDVVGSYTVQLVVNDGVVNSAADSMILTTAVGYDPNITSDTCKTPSAQGTCPSAVFNYSSGQISSITSLFYVKNIGGAGTIDVTVGAGEYTENVKFAVDAGARYTLKSVIPVNLWPTPSPSIGTLYVTASTQIFSKTNNLGTYYSPTGASRYYKYVVRGVPISSLVVE